MMQKKRAIKVSISLLLVLILANFSQYCTAADTEITRADAALYFAEHLNIEHSNVPEDLYGLAYGIFPGDYNGKNDITNYDKAMTLEIAIVVLVRYAGWNTVVYNQDIAEQIAPYVTQEGFPYYQPDPTPRSIPYIVVALEKGLLKENELSTLTSKIGYRELDQLLTRLDMIEGEQLTPRLFIPKDSVEEAKNSIPEFVILDNNITDSESLYSGEDTAIDFRADGIRIYKGTTGVSGKKQNYFPLGALESVLSVGLEVSQDSYTHQSEGIYSTIENYSTTTNGVALWGEATSKADGARVWGGFLTATSQKDMDAQLVGLEVDVTNDSLPGVHPNQSKVGMQIVALGSYGCTNSIEVLAAEDSSWHNGILITNGTISENGTILGCAQDTPIMTGIDFTNTPFTNAAIDISNNSKIVMQSKSGNPTAVYADDINNGYLVLQAGASGLRITNNANDENLLILNADGSISPDCLIYKNILDKATIGKTVGFLFPGTMISLITVCIILYIKLYKQSKQLKAIQEVVENITFPNTQ